MDKNVSIILSREVNNFRKLAQCWYNLTDDQMVGMHVHHNPPRHQGGRNIPEHLFVYHCTLHSAVHGNDFTMWASEGGRMGGIAGDKDKKRLHGLKCKEEGIGMFSSAVTKEQRRKWNQEAGKKGAAAQPHETRVKIGTNLGRRNLQFTDPEHPELGSHNAGNLVKIQKSKGLPHGKENRRRALG